MLGRLFGKKGLDELRSHAGRLYDEAKWGEAKLAYDRLEERAEKEDAEISAFARGRASLCCDHISDARVAEARTLFRNGQLDFAREELRNALETARSDDAKQRVIEAQREIEQRDAIEQAETLEQPSDEERMMLLASSWEPLQAEELESYGDELLHALLAIEDGRGEEALAVLERLLAAEKEPSYLWLEVGRARLVGNDLDGAQVALRTFLTRIGPEEGGTARITAHRELARLAHDRSDHDAAVAELEACAEALEDDPRPLFELGNYLRTIGRAAEAIEVLELCGSLFPDDAIEWPVTMELGLACAAAGQRERAVKALESVLGLLAARGHLDFPPAAAVALAKLHEEGGNLARAADLYRALTAGSDGLSHVVYHTEAARLLEQIGLPDEARRMRERADGLKKSAPPTVP